MRSARFHALAWYRPEARFKIDLIPGGKADLAGPGGSKNKRLKRQAPHGGTVAKLLNEGRHIRIRHRFEVPVFLGLPRQPLGKRAHRRFGRPKSLGIRPVKHSPDALPDSAGRLWLGEPDGCQDIPDNRPLDLVDGPSAQRRKCVGLQCGEPLSLMLAVLPGRLVLLVYCFRRFFEGRNDESLGAPFGNRIDTARDLPS